MSALPVRTRTVTAADDIENSDLGITILVDATSQVLLTLDDGLIAGFWCLVRQVGTGQAKIVGTAGLNNLSNHDATRQRYSLINIAFISLDEYAIDGDSTEGT